MNIDQLLKSVSKPGRYTGGEWGQTVKEKQDIKCRWAFCFPDTYEIGMSNLGIRLLYGALNAEPDVWCERCFAPWTDMEAEMRKHNIPLWALESGDPIKSFDIVAFTLGYELSYSNVLYMLDLGGIPLTPAERGEDAPIVIGGGCCTYNPEPLADFFDIFSIGEGEEALPELSRLYITMKDNGTYTRENFLHEAAKLGGFYVPSFYSVSYYNDGTIAAVTKKYDDIPDKITKRIIKDFDKSYFPESTFMPFIDTVQDRIMLEVYRGCPRGCRFCQAGMVYRPIREKSPDVLAKQAKCLYENTGYEEISLSSLSISDYTRLPQLTESLLDWTDDAMVSLALPSLRADTFTKELMDRISSVRTSTLTFAPEAGSQRLRDVINKNVTEEEILNACRLAFEAGKNQVKLYFMIGHPTETNEDLDGIFELSEHVIHEFYVNKRKDKQIGKPNKGGVQVTLSVAAFVPKPFTAFQWEKQDALDVTLEKQKYLKNVITDRKVRYNYHDAQVGRIEGVFARGDRKLCAALLEAHKRGIRFDAWEEFFSYDAWMEIFSAVGVDADFYTTRGFGLDEILPWDIIDCGVDKSFLLRERTKAYETKTTRNCMEACSACGADKLGGEQTWCNRELCKHKQKQ